MRLIVAVTVLLLIVLRGAAFAHVGSPDILHAANAGPYRLLVSIQAPPAIPGIAHAEIRSSTLELDSLELVAMPIGTDAYPPRSEPAHRSSLDKQFYTTDLWIMTPGSWKVRVTARGSLGTGELSLPIASLPGKAETMQAGIAILLGIMMLVLTAGAVGIVGAAIRESHLLHGKPISPANDRRARGWMLGTVIVAATIFSYGSIAWMDTADRYARIMYRPLALTPWVDEEGKLFLRLRDPGWLSSRRLDDFVPDHGHLMHLYVVRLPSLDLVGHLHPDQMEDGLFARSLPAMPRGRYRLFADVVHRSGLAETIVNDIQLDDIPGHLLQGDDAWGEAVPLGTGSTSNQVRWPDGSSMIWDRPSEPIRKGRPESLHFRMLDAEGKPADDVELYMGMMGHLAVIRTDLSVFAHLHPTGTIPMAALAVAQSDPTTESMPQSHMMPDGHMMPNGMMHGGLAMQDVLPADVTFPYLFPQAGSYRLFVQMKRAHRVMTAGFEMSVSER